MAGRTALWTDENLTYLRKFYGRYKISRMALELVMTPGQVSYMATKLKLTKKHSGLWNFSGNGRYWLRLEIKYLLKHFPFGNLKEISWEINRTINAIQLKAEAMFIEKGKPFQRNEKRIRSILRRHNNICNADDEKKKNYFTLMNYYRYTKI